MKAKSMMITPVLNGFVVKVGCQEVVFNNIDAMTDEIRVYYRNPESIERVYLKNAINEIGITPPDTNHPIRMDTPDPATAEGRPSMHRK